ncbi:hypothetical protein NP493_606g03039 [Ridgeia piscesae]|uniref:Sulfide:quinone oxidoreductase, mitochondrial n=1 Tax=Ridgeia piscesae TaxID=27915 RepID=A0AAD9KV42_RIDPI|nr:hypothetical protein NP493_606g03039 [Ridgeia piscesae]
MTAARLVRRCNHCSKHDVVAALSSPSQSSLPRRQFSTTDRRSSQDSYKLLVLGGGTAGSAVANKFAAKLGRGNVAVVEPSKKHYYQAMFTLIGGGLKEFDMSHRPTEAILPRKCHWIEARVAGICPDDSAVSLTNGRTINYEYLVVALGMQTNYHLVKGLLDALEHDPAVCSNYHPKYVQKTFPAMQAFKEGNAIFTFPNTPIKCAGAPQKVLYLAEDYFRRTGKRDKATVMYNTPIGVVFGIKKYAQTLHDQILERDIKLNLRRNLVEVKHETREAVFEVLDAEGRTETYNYEMLHVAPPCSAPEVLWDNPLSDKSGFVDVNRETCQHTRYMNVFSLGDCSNLPTSKTAAAISGQVGVLGKNLAQVMSGKPPTGKYNGYSSCPVVTKKGFCILAEFGYDGKLMETFPYNQAVPRRSSYLMKALAMPQLYWLLLVK